MNSTPLPDPVRVTCPRCGRSGQYRRARFIEIAGTDNAIGALLPFARMMRCPVAQAQDWQTWGDRCGVVYDGQ